MASGSRSISAQEEGILRNHVITEGGRVRDTVYHAIIAGDWPAVRRSLEARLARPADCQ